MSDLRSPSIPAFRIGDFVRVKGFPGVDGQVVRVYHRGRNGVATVEHVTVAWPIPGRRRKCRVAYSPDELEVTDATV